MSKPITAAKRLAECISASIDPQHNEFLWDAFFRSWYREQGTPLYFLFRKHLGVTNVQYAELIELIQNLATDTTTNLPVGQLVFQTTESLKATIVETVNSLLDIPKSRRASHIDRFAKLYADVFVGTAAVDMFYCSSAVFLPPGLNLDLERLCAQSGYVHSAGRSIYIRNIKKARQQDFELSIESHLAKQGTSSTPTPFVVYAHEDFSDFDKEAKDQINRGIDSTKLYVEKMSMGGYRLSQVVQDLRARFKGRLEVPRPGSYKKEHKFQGSRTIWLVGDRSISNASILNPGGDRYYICYEQYAKNDSPFFFFDENKPAWKSHTTLPHSLTAALLNVTLPHASASVICDPFGGTGTTWFEAKRISPQAKVISSDLSPVTPQLVADNLRFFLADVMELRTIHGQLMQTLEAIRRGIVSDEQPSLLDGPEEGTTSITAYISAKDLLDRLRNEQPTEEQEFEFTDEFVAELARQSYLCRLLFYTALRAELRYQGSYKRNSMTRSKAFERSLEEIVLQTTKHLQTREKLAEGDEKPEHCYVRFQGTYSPVVVPSIFVDNLQSLERQLAKEVRVADATTLRQGSLDIVVCDPPYGFNTTEESSTLAQLYSDFLDAAILSLRSGGHLIIALPAESYTGRELPYCTKSGLLISQILVKARKLDRHLFMPAAGVPHKLLRPPYYWEAERALRRTILHFRVGY